MKKILLLAVFMVNPIHAQDKVVDVFESEIHVSSDIISKFAPFKLEEEPIFKCKKHGLIGNSTMFVNSGKYGEAHYCMKCLMEVLDVTIGRAKEVKRK